MNPGINSQAPALMRPGFGSAAAAPPRVSVARPVQAAEPFFYIAALYIFLYSSRLIEFIPTSLRPLMLLGGLLISLGAMTGRLAAAFASPIARLLGVFSVLMAVSTIFSTWRGGSFPFFMDVTKVLLMVVIISAFAQTVQQCFKMIHVLGWAFGTTALLSFVARGEVEGRLVVGEGMLADPNFYCTYLLAGVPLIWFKGRHASVLGKLMAIGMGLLVLKTALATGSRGGMIALAAGTLFLFFISPSRQKIKMVVFAAALGASLLIFAPASAFERLTIFLQPENADSRIEESAAGSAASRKYLLIRSLQLTLWNPLLGVGPGVFASAESADAVRDGLKPAWHNTHNMYTQVSSEMGIPALGVFLAALVTAFRRLNSIRKAFTGPDKPAQIRDAAAYLQMSLVIIAVEGIFLHIAYTGPFWAVMSLVIAFELAVRRETIPQGNPSPPPAWPSLARSSSLPSGSQGSLAGAT